MNRSKNKKYRGKNAPLWGDRIINIIFKFTFGVLIFWVLYYPLYLSEEMDIYSKISFIMLYSIISSFLAIIASFITVALINRAFKFSKKGITDLNKMPDLNAMLSELIALILNAFAQVLGLIWILNTNIGNESWYTFLLIYSVLKITTRIIAIFIATIISKNVLLTVSFLILFGSALAISFIQIQKVIING